MIRRLYLLLALLAAPAAYAEEPAPVQEKVLVPLQVITGGQLAARQDANGFPVPGELAGFSTFVFPSALAVRDPDVYIADSGTRKVYRFDMVLQVLSIVPNVVAMPWTRLQVGADQSLFVLDAGSSAVLHFTRGGQKLGVFGDSLAGASLGEFAVDDSLGRIVATDRLNQRLMALSPLGGPSLLLGSTEKGEFAALGALAKHGDVIYAVDAGCTCIAGISEDGKVREHIGQGVLKLPHALAVARDGYIFVGDSFDQTLKIFSRDKLVASYEAKTLRLTEISALAIDGGALYIADGPGSQVAVFRIRSPRREKE